MKPMFLCSADGTFCELFGADWMPGWEELHTSNPRVQEVLSHPLVTVLVVDEEKLRRLGKYRLVEMLMEVAKPDGMDGVTSWLSRHGVEWEVQIGANAFA